jgi:hypothetical protein
MDGYIDRWMDRWADRQIYEYIDRRCGVGIGSHHGEVEKFLTMPSVSREQGSQWCDSDSSKA